MQAPSQGAAAPVAGGAGAIHGEVAGRVAGFMMAAGLLLAGLKSQLLIFLDYFKLIL